MFDFDTFRSNLGGAFEAQKFISNLRATPLFPALLTIQLRKIGIGTKIANPSIVTLFRTHKGVTKFTIKGVY
jgi:hypothetical protein